MITIYRKAFFYEQLKLEKISFFEVPSSCFIVLTSVSLSATPG